MRPLLRSLVLLALAGCGSAFADESADIAHLQTRWAEVNYGLPQAQREKAFAELAAEAEGLRKAHPDSAPYLVWEGIIRSTYAGAKGGLGALGECKKARALFDWEEKEILPSARQVLRMLQDLGSVRDPREGGRMNRSNLEFLLEEYGRRFAEDGGVRLTWRPWIALLQRA